MDDAHFYDWFSKALGAKRDPALRCLRCQNRASVFNEHEAAFLERVERRAANERIPSCDGHSCHTNRGSATATNKVAGLAVNVIAGQKRFRDSRRDYTR